MYTVSNFACYLWDELSFTANLRSVYGNLRKVLEVCGGKYGLQTACSELVSQGVASASS